MTHLRFAWEQDVADPVRGALTATLSIPDEAWLHDLAGEYLTDLTVRLQGRDSKGLVAVELVMPAAFLAWPNGRSAGPEVWDAGTAEVLAPRGIVSNVLRAEMPALPGFETIRTLPPISRGGDPIGDETETDPDRAHFTNEEEG